MPELHPEAEPYAAFPGARPPDRSGWVDSSGISIRVVEWGPSDAPPLLLAHGGHDFARTHDLFAPRLADAGWRVVSWDHRGHGDSDRASLYSWEADLRDAVAVLDSVSQGPVQLVGHSKGGGLLIDLAHLSPERFPRLVNLDGLPSKGPASGAGESQTDRPESERVRLRAEWLSNALDRGLKASTARRRPGTLEELAARRQRMNPRLPIEWLRYLAAIGARRDEDGWRWKLDPALTMSRFGPWRPDWGLRRLSELRVPMLALLSSVQEPMSWHTTPEDMAPFLSSDTVVELVEGCGHFLHIEDVEGVARRTLSFLT